MNTPQQHALPHRKASRTYIRSSDDMQTKMRSMFGSGSGRHTTTEIDAVHNGDCIDEHVPDQCRERESFH